MKVGQSGAKILSLTAALENPLRPASTANPSSQEGDKSASSSNSSKRQPKDILCRNSDSDQMCTRPRCSFYHPRKSDHCTTWLNGGGCLRGSAGTCMRRHNQAERERYKASQKSNDRKRNRRDQEDDQARKRIRSVGSPQSRREVSNYSARPRYNSTNLQGDIGPSSSSFREPSRRTAGRSPARRPALPSRRR